MSQKYKKNFLGTNLKPGDARKFVTKT